MRSFVDLETLVGAVPYDVVRQLKSVDTGRGTEALYETRLPALLAELASRARVASVTASSAIEGVVVADQNRAAAILANRPTPLRTRSEQELAGYRTAVDYLLSQEWRPLNIGLILHLHRLLFAETPLPSGRFKTEDNLVVDRRPDGRTVERFRPTPAREVEFAMQELVARFTEARQRDQHHPVILTGLFVLDLLTIHPFLDGNGRIARVLTNALLVDAGYGVTRYVPFEQLVADRADDYYASLLRSTQGWPEGRHDPWPWLRYFTALVAECYRLFAVHVTTEAPTSKRERVRRYVLEQAPPVFRINDVRLALAGISDQTIRQVLAELRRQGLAQPDGVGRGASWRRTSGS